MQTSVEAGEAESMQTLDDAWNGQDVEIFRALAGFLQQIGLGK